MPWAKAATEEDWATEYLDLILAVKVVPDLTAAIDHINRYGPAIRSVLLLLTMPPPVDSCKTWMLLPFMLMLPPGLPMVMNSVSVPNWGFPPKSFTPADPWASSLNNDQIYYLWRRTDPEMKGIGIYGEV